MAAASPACSGSRQACGPCRSAHRSVSVALHPDMLALVCNTIMPFASLPDVKRSDLSRYQSSGKASGPLKGCLNDSARHRNFIMLLADFFCIIYCYQACLLCSNDGLVCCTILIRLLVTTGSQRRLLAGQKGYLLHGSKSEALPVQQFSSDSIITLGA